MHPFHPGSVSLRLYPHNDLIEPSRIIAELCDQAQLGLRGGFDGIMLSEHHGGFPGYLPLPTMFSAFVLEENPTGWVAPAPLLLPLRPTAQIAEELAWLEARHPGRVGVGVASGGLRSDFEIMGLHFEEASQRFIAELPHLVDLLSGRNLGDLRLDAAMAQLSVGQIPILSAAMSRTACVRAAGLGIGLLFEGLTPPEHLAPLSAAFRDAGGAGPRVLIRRVWLGRPLTDVIERQREVYSTMGGSRAARELPEDQTITSDDPIDLAERIARAVTTSGCDSVNIRLHLPALAPEAIREQIAGISSDVLPRLRQLLRPT